MKMEENVTELMSRDDALMFLKDHIGKEWRDIGRYLDIKEAELDLIQADNQGNAKEMCYQMLLKWVSKNGKAATVPVLAAALCNSGKRSLADKLVKERSPAASSKETQSVFSNVSRDTVNRDTVNRDTVNRDTVNKDSHVRDAERQIPNRLLRPGVWFTVFAVAMVIIAYCAGPNSKDESRVTSGRKSSMDEMSMNNVMEQDKLDKAINIVKNSLTKEWQDVARFLGLSHPDLEHIREEYDRNPKERNYQMLQKWREQFGNEATLDALKDSLRKAGRRDLEEKLP